jgi:putative flippase GtrA
MVLIKFTRFVLVGGVATSIQYLLLFGLVHWTGANPVLASSLGFVVSAFANYLLNYYYTFRSKHEHGPALLKFMVIAGVGLILNLMIMQILTGETLHYLIAQVIATAVVLLWSFAGNSLWTFRTDSVSRMGTAEELDSKSLRLVGLQNASGYLDEMTHLKCKPTPVNVNEMHSDSLAKVACLDTMKPFYFLFILILFCIIAIHRLSDFVGIRFATADNIDFSVGRFESHKHINPLQLGWAMAEEQGRLPHIVITTVDTLVSMIRNQVFYDILNIGSFSLALVLLSILLSRLVSIWFSFVFLALSLACLPQLWSHTPPAAYPVWPWLPWISFALSGLSLLRYSCHKEHLWLWLAGFFYAASFFSLELFVLVFPVCALVIILSAPRRSSLSRKERTWLCASAILIPAIYLALYVCFRLYNPSQYDGNRVGVILLANILSVLYQYSIGGFSLYYVLRGKYPVLYNDSADHSQFPLIPTLSLPDAFLTGIWFDWVAALISAVLLSVSLWNLRLTRLTTRTSVILLTGAWVAFASLFLYGISEKYSAKIYDVWSAYYFAYVGTRYAYFGWILAVSGLLVAICAISVRRHTRFRIIVVLACGLGIFSLSMISSYFNRFVSASMRVQTAKWRVVDIALSCEPLWTGIDDRPIFAPRLNSFVWWAFIRPPGEPETQRSEYWNQYSFSRGLSNGPRFAATKSATDEDGYSMMDYRLGVDGSILGIFSALQNSQGKTNDIRILSLRDKSIQVLLNDDRGRRVNVVSWNAKSDSCGAYMVNRLSGNGIVISSITLWSPPTVPLNNPIP